MSVVTIFGNPWHSNFAIFGNFKGVQCRLCTNECQNWQHLVQQFLPLLAIFNTSYLVPYCWTYWYCHFWQLQRCALQPELAMFSSTISAIIGNFLTLLVILDILILPFLATLGIKFYIIIIIIVHTGSIQMISKIDNFAFVGNFQQKLVLYFNFQ